MIIEWISDHIRLICQKVNRKIGIYFIFRTRTTMESGCARSRYTLKLSLIFQSLNELINEQSVSSGKKEILMKLL